MNAAAGRAKRKTAGDGRQRQPRRPCTPDCAAIVPISPQVFSLDATAAAGARTAAANHGAAGQCPRALAPPRARPVQRPRAGRSFDRIEQSISSYQLDDFAYKQYLQGSVHAIAAADYPLQQETSSPFRNARLLASCWCSNALLRTRQRTIPRSRPPPEFSPFNISIHFHRTIRERDTAGI